MATIKKNLSDLPVAAPDAGTPPNPNPKFTTRLAEKWYERLLEAGVELDLAIPDAGPYRASYSSKRCDRALHYALDGTEQSNPPTIADQWRFALGHAVHEIMQDVMPDVHDGKVVAELDVDLTPAGIPGSAHADLVIYDEDDNPLVVLELKSINGFAFKLAASTFKGPPQGPRSGHCLQAAMVAQAIGAPYFAVCYFSLENLSPSMAKGFANGEIGRFAAEWRYKTEDWTAEVNREAQRIQRVLANIESDTLTERRLDDPEYPPEAIVDEPDRKGRWTATTDDGIVVGSGTTWMCDGYCPYFDKCIADGPS